MKTLIERLPASSFASNLRDLEAKGPGIRYGEAPRLDFDVELDRWKRLRRQGWRLTVLQELESDDIIALGWLDEGLEPEPDRRGQLELDVETFRS